MKQYSRVCIANNAHVLFQYFLLSSLNEINNTYFFFTEDIKEDVASRFEHTRLCLPSGKVRQFFYIVWLKFFSDYRWPFLKSCEFWGQDNLLITSPLIKNRKIILPEDGLLNYTYRPRKRHFKRLRRFLFGNLQSECSLGYSRNVEHMYLTGAKEIPEGLKQKAQIVDYSHIWKTSSIEKKNYISKVFGMSSDVAEVFKGNPRVLFTQPLSEDKILSEDEKINIYKKLVDSVGNELIIKTHPREITNYREIFPRNVVFDKPIPLELLSLVGIRFSEVYTLFSSSVLNLPTCTKVHWLGCYGSESLKERYGDSINYPSSI